MTLREQLNDLYRDVATVLEVAKRRSDPPAEYIAMTQRLQLWRDKLSGTLTALDDVELEIEALKVEYHALQEKHIKALQLHIDDVKAHMRNLQ